MQNQPYEVNQPPMAANSLAIYEKRGRNAKGTNMYNYLNKGPNQASPGQPGYPKTQNQAFAHHQRNKTHLMPGAAIQNQGVFRNSIALADGQPSTNQRLSLNTNKQLPHTQKLSGKATGKHSKQASYGQSAQFTQGQTAARVQSGNTRASKQGGSAVYLKTDGSQGSQGQQSMNAQFLSQPQPNKGQQKHPSGLARTSA